MGLVLNKGDKIYFDANIFIYSVEDKQPYSIKIKEIFKEIVDKEAILITSEMTICEVLVKPFKDKNDIMIDIFKKVLTPNRYFTILPVSRNVLLLSAEIRANNRLKTPDSIHLATVLSAKCDYFITNDKAFKAASNTTTLSINEL